MTNGKRALVTGGAGLIGSHVVDLLVREGWRVLGRGQARGGLVANRTAHRPIAALQ